MGRRSALLVLLAGAILVGLCSSRAAAQDEPLELQQRAIRRIDAYIDHFRKTGDMREMAPELAQAETELTSSNSALAARENWSALSLGLIKLGAIHRMRAEWNAAIEAYQQAEEAAKRGHEVAREAEAISWRAQAESFSRDFGTALADAMRAQQLAESIDDKGIQARALDVIADVQTKQNDLAGAARTAERELGIALETQDPVTIYRAHLARYNVYYAVAQTCDFQVEFAPCYEAIEHARSEIEAAIDIVRQQNYRGLVLWTQLELDGLKRREALIKGREQRGIVLQKDNQFHPKQPAQVLVTEYFVFPPGKPSAAVEQMREDLKRIEEAAGEFADLAGAGMHYTQGLASQSKGDNEGALKHYLGAIDVLEHERRGLRDDRSRATFLDDHIDVYYHAALQLLQQRRYAEAFDVLERSRSRAMADLLASRPLTLGRPEQQKLYAEDVALRTRIGAAQAELFELAANPDAAGRKQRIAGLKTRLSSLDADYQKLAARIAAEAPQLQQLAVSQPATLDALQRSMHEEDYEMLQYVVLENALILWHITADNVFVRNVFLPRNEVIRKVAALHESLADPGNAFDEVTARELFLFLVQPALARVHSRHLVIVPHEDLGHIPFQALLDPSDGRFLGERLEISYAPSASVLLNLNRASEIAGGKLLAIADPAIDKAGPEVVAIAKLFPGTSKVVKDQLPSKAQVEHWMKDFNVIHLAVHGKFDASEPLLSYLSFAGAGDQSKLTAAEMFGLPLDNSRLVVLSACESGRTEATHGNEVLGIVRGLVYAGAGTLVLSGWQVNSAATAVWMESFYQAAQSAPLPRAAQAASERVKAMPEYSHPYYWAAFSLIGR